MSSVCRENECIVWFDYHQDRWIVSTDCEGDCDCPKEILPQGSVIATPPFFDGGSSPVTILTCVESTNKEGESVCRYYHYRPGNEGSEYVGAIEIIDPQRKHAPISLTGFGTIHWTNHWLSSCMMDKFKIVGCDLFRNQDAPSTQKPVRMKCDEYPQSQFPDCSGTGLPSGTCALLYGAKDTSNLDQYDFEDPFVAGIANFVEWPVPDHVTKTAGLWHEYFQLPLFEVKKTAAVN